MSDGKTHTVRPKPSMSAPYLADFMAASEPARRTIVQGSKFIPHARIIQHDEAKSTVAKFIRDQDTDLSWLDEEAQRLRQRIADSDFDRDLYDHNAAYIARFAKVWPAVVMPVTQLVAPGRLNPLAINGVTVSIELQFRLSRMTRTNKLKIGGVTFRYAKNKALSPAVAAWQTAFMFGYLRDTGLDHNAEPDRPLCLTFDIFAGQLHEAPGDSVRRYNQMRAACATIAEWWPNIKPPPNAVV